MTVGPGGAWVRDEGYAGAVTVAAVAADKTSLAYLSTGTGTGPARRRWRAGPKSDHRR
ncbi:hypothetical protein GCM10018772_01410 [Streptomyces fumanus]|uniref:Uncharacterized protein n=1 Tax=Streptomyces fumanus TaxID=67302 RepID=A0A919A385_9ACTN|nr:hypothetical protein GCM10018772_01410 [Streptomyces fumanus]